MNLSFTRSNQPIVPPPAQVILASQSIGRKFLLEKLGIHFRTVISRIDEDTIQDRNTLKMIKKRAAAKVNEIINHPRVYSLGEETKYIIIAADSMAIIGRRTYGKSLDREDTKRIVKELMNRTHTFSTAVSIVLYDQAKVVKRWEKIVSTRVALRRMTQAEIDSYVNRYDFTRFAAGYAVNEAPWDFVTKIDGSYTNVIGLPFEVLLPILRKLEVII